MPSGTGHGQLNPIEVLLYVLAGVVLLGTLLASLTTITLVRFRQLRS